MTTRRDFIKLNLGAASVVTLFPIAAGGAGFDDGVKQPLAAVLYDTRIPGASKFARSVAGQAKRSFPAEGDLGAIWMNDFLPAMAMGSTWVAGVTSGHHAFAIQEAARDFGHALVHSEYFDAQHFDAQPSNNNAGGTSNYTPGKARIDILALNTPQPVFWLLGPAGINFRG